MKKKILMRIFFIIMILVGLFLLWIMGLWLMNGGRPENNASGEKMPIHITKVQPYDGELVTSLRSYCLYFSFFAGKGMGEYPDKSVHYFYDGIDVTSQTDGLITLDIPPSVGLYCYKPSVQFSEGWHSAKVSYKDVTGESFDYLWRFQVVKD